MENKYWLSDEDFNSVYGKVPRLNVDLLIRKNGEIIMVQRSIEPYLDYWHLPGGTVYKNETIKEASMRIAKDETGLDVDFVGCLDYMEFLNENRKPINTHTISIVIEVIAVGGNLIHDKNAKDIKTISKLSDVSPIVTEHLDFLQKHKIFD